MERGKNVSVEFRVFGKKKEIEREKNSEKKNQSFFCFLVKILLSSCSLVGFFCEKEMFLKFEEKKKKFGCVLPR